MKANFHTHTTFCDGKDSPETMAKIAYKKGFSALGFSAHSLHPFSTDWHISATAFDEYVQTINKIKEAYKDKMEILLGFEVDYLPPFSFPDLNKYHKIGADYIIGSVHYIASSNDFFTVDGPVEEVAYGIEKVFKGNGKKAVQTYFSLLREMIRNCKFDIIGHLDVIRKRNGVLKFFDESESWYKKEITATVKEIAKAGQIVEINTGGMARGVIQDTYPSAEFLSLLNKAAVPIMINSDAHQAQQLDFAFTDTYQKALAAGYKEAVYLHRYENRIQEQNISLEQLLLRE